MKSGGALLLVVVGVLLLWIVTTGRLAQLSDAWGVLQGTKTAGDAAAGDGGASALNMSNQGGASAPVTGAPGDFSYISSSAGTPVRAASALARPSVWRAVEAPRNS